MATYTEDQMIAIGGRAWEGRTGTRRVYLNDWTARVGIEIGRYNSGNISWAAIDGEQISNSKAYKLIGAKAYWQDGEIYTSIPAAADSARLDGHALVRRLLASIAADLAPELTARQAAEKLGVSVRTVQRHAKQGKLTARKDDRGRWIITL